MKEEEEEIKRNINNITCDTSFQSSIAMNVQKKDASLSLKRQLASGILAEMFEIFKRCTIQSTISDSAHISYGREVDEINNSEEQVDARNWLRNNSAEQADQINYSDKQVDAIGDSKKKM